MIRDKLGPVRTRLVLAIVAASCLLLGAAAAAQASITVANQNDSGPGSLRQAILEAGAGETIALPAGIYTLTSKPLVIEKSVTFSGHGAGDTTIRAGGQFRVFEEAEATGPLDVTFSALTIRDGEVVETVPKGAGLYADEANLTLRGVVIANNHADADAVKPGLSGGVGEGGGIWIDKGSIVISDSRVEGNSATGVGGSGSNGGVLEGGGIWLGEGPLTATNTTMSGNFVDGRGGGGPPSALQNGGVAEGGALWVGEGALTVVNSIFSGNSVNVNSGPGSHGGVGEGGAIWASGQVSVTNSSMTGNAVEANGGQGPAAEGQSGGFSQGGGLWSGQDTSVASSLIGSTVSGNLIDASGGPGGKAGTVQGGGIFEQVGLAPMSLSNSTLASNIARARSELPSGIAQGGGIFNIPGKSGSLVITSATIVGNRVETGGNDLADGGNVWAEKPVSAKSSIVAGGAGSAGQVNCGQPLDTSLGFNLESGDDCGFHAAGDQVNKNPLLGPLQANGGPTATMAPLLGSPAIDQGSAAGLATDQRGALRPFEFPSIPNSAAAGADGSDVGAFELQPTSTFSLGRLAKNKRKGTATLAVLLPQPSVGTLTLRGKGLKEQSVAIAGQSEVVLTVVTKGGARKSLRRKGKRAVGIEVVYAPPTIAAASLSTTTKLIRKHRKHRKKHHKHRSRP